MPPVVSIIICTRNRAESLRETLASIGRCEVLADLPAELLVVDNGSTDHTKQVVEQANLPNMPVRHIDEPTPGQCHARNRGLADATGEIILFTDDDVRVPRKWIEGMCRLIVKGEADATTGEIAVAPHLLRPWMTESHRRHLLEIPDLSEQHAKRPFLIGANMAFRRHVLRHVHRFDTELGPGGRGFMDDTLFYLQLLAAGYRLRFAAGVPVEHHFDSVRLTRTAQLLSARAHGRSTAYVMHHWSHEEVRWRRLRLVANAFRLMLRRAHWLLSGRTGFDPDEVIYARRFSTYFELGRLEAAERIYPRRGNYNRQGDQHDSTTVLSPSEVAPTAGI